MKKEKIVYKVVDSYRRSIISNSAVHLRHLLLKYEKDTVVRAKPKTFGIFCFESEEDAVRYQREWHLSEVLRCKAKGRQLKTPIFIVNLKTLSYEYKKHTKEINLSLLHKKNSCRAEHSYKINNWVVPAGTVCYQAVEVLE